MLDIKLVRDRADHVRERLGARGAGDESRIDEVLALDADLRSRLAEAEGLKAQRNAASKQIGALMGQKKLAEAEARKAEVREIGDRITALDRACTELEARRDEILLSLPNLPHASVALGRTAEDNPVIRTWGAPAAFAFQPKSHVELCETLRLVDFARGAKLSGSGFLLYTGCSSGP
jgi:seryl-tRNA synthetase